jgi:nicotinamidase-related amidase
MQQKFGLNIPRTLEEICDPTRMALLVYDMQVGVVSQIRNGPEITSRVLRLLQAAREGGFRVFFNRYMTLPKEVAGVSQLRMAMDCSTWIQSTKSSRDFSATLLNFRFVRSCRRSGAKRSSTGLPCPRLRVRR